MQVLASGVVPALTSLVQSSDTRARTKGALALRMMSLYGDSKVSEEVEHTHTQTHRHMHAHTCMDIHTHAQIPCNRAHGQTSTQAYRYAHVASV